LTTFDIFICKAGSVSPCMGKKVLYMVIRVRVQKV
jgi:hypothetical protein